MFQIILLWFSEKWISQISADRMREIDIISASCVTCETRYDPLQEIYLLKKHNA
jgi:hypothetical protein